MKKMASLIWVPLLLGSCFTVNHKKNYFVVGQFETVVDEVGYYLEVEEISESVFSSSNGINTVKDVVIGKYFSVEFREDVDGEITLINLINLRDEHPRTKAVPASYIDDNGTSISPGITDNKYSNTNYYLVVYKLTYIYFKKGA